MKIKQAYTFGFFLLLLLGVQQINAQLVKETSITAENADLQMIAPNSYLLEIGGADGYYFKEEVPYTDRISIGNINKDGEKFADGSYMMQVTPIVKLTEEERKELRALQADNDQNKIAAFRADHNLPNQVEVYNIYFSIRNGQFVTPEQKEGRMMKLPSMSGVWQQDHPALYASLESVEMTYGMKTSGSKLPAMDKSADDQVFVDDVIVDGSLCVGMDCANGENFGFDTQRIKENNVRIHFDDTSASASFPSNDWRITINDSSNGGASYFAVEDATAGRIPFRIISGAPANALYIDAQGDIGIGNANPIVETHITDGDSPTIRLEQDGSSGFGSQTWDIAGNETNFFIRDVTNGSLLPFRIKPRAPKNSIFIDSDGDIGLGTESPSYKLQIQSGDVYMRAGNLGINKEPTVALDVLGTSKFEGASVYTGNVSYFLPTNATFFTDAFLPIMKIDAATRFVGIQNNNPGVELDVCGTIAATNTTVAMSTTCSSDIRFKKNIQPLASSLDKLLQLKGVNYNWKVAEFPEKGFNDKTQIGFIAQEMETLFPALVTTDVKGYKAVDYAKLTPVLVEAVKEQQDIIDTQQEEIAALQQQVEELQGLKAQVAALTGMVSALNQGEEGDQGDIETTGEKE